MTLFWCLNVGVAAGRFRVGACMFWKYAQPELDLINKRCKTLKPDMTRLINESNRLNGLNATRQPENYVFSYKKNNILTKIYIERVVSTCL